METGMKTIEDETAWEAIDNMGLETAILDELLEVIETAADQEDLPLGRSIGSAVWIARKILQRQRDRLHKHGAALFGGQ